jgi:trehalose 6-phosphate phosphatase
MALVGSRALDGSSTAATLSLPSPSAVRAFLRGFADGQESGRNEVPA